MFFMSSTSADAILTLTSTGFTAVCVLAHTPSPPGQFRVHMSQVCANTSVVSPKQTKLDRTRAE